MSDNIPFDIQMEIIEKVSDVKSLIQFRSVSKQWKSFIDSSKFIIGCHTQPHSFILRYKVREANEVKYFRLVEDHDNNATIKLQQQEFAPSVVSTLIKQFDCEFVGASHGLVCLYSIAKRMLVIWNPSIRKSFGIVVPNRSFSLRTFYGFGVSPDTSDPTVVKIIQTHNKPWNVEVFTLSSGVWNVIPSSNLLRQSIQVTFLQQVVIDRFIYWVAYDTTFVNGVSHDKYMLVSFDLITKEFKPIDLPDSLTYKPYRLVKLSLSKTRESLVVYGPVYVDQVEYIGVWVMEHDSSFKMLFSIDTRVDKILGFTGTGEPIVTRLLGYFTTLYVYNLCSQHINYLGIYGVKDTFVMDSYKESLLLLNHSDLHIYCGDNQ